MNLQCPHLIRRRDIHCGFASAETVCDACGQSFDTERELELRERDRRRGHSTATPRAESGKGYIVG